MSKKTNTGLVSFCKECLAAKLGYVYSAFGRVCTKSLLDQAASNYLANNLAGGAMREVGEKWLGRRVVDCSGMIKYYLMADKFGDDPKYTAALDTAVHISKASKEPFPPCRKCREPFYGCLGMWGYTLEMGR